MKTISVPSVEHAAAISRGLWLLSRPEPVGSADDTQFSASWEERPGAVLLLMDPAWSLPVHPAVVAQITDPTDASGAQAQMAQLLGPILTNPEQGMQEVAAAIAQGGALSIGALLPLVKPELVADYTPLERGP